MKKIQDPIFKLTVVLVCLFAVMSAVPSAVALAKAEDLAKADSLFHLKQYTQSMEIYQSIFRDKSYSPAMLVKMAYVEEGLGHLAQSMYFLNLYYITTHDPQALAKLENVAAKNRLEGYASSDATRVATLLRENYQQGIFALAAVCLFFLALSFWQKVKRQKKAFAPALFLLIFLALLFVHTYFNAQPVEGIVTNPATYLMEGPSAGSSVISIVGEGHRLEILGHHDVWIKVKWLNREVFVKKDELAVLEL